MAKKRVTTDEQIVALLQHLLAIELWRGGLSQLQIRTRLGLATTTVNDMLKGVQRNIQIEQDE